MTTDQLSDELDRLATLSGELDPPQGERAELLHQVSAYLETFIAGLSEIKGFQQRSVGDLAIRGERSSIQDLLTRYRTEVAENGINAASPKHLGYIPGGGVFTAALADLIAAVTNPFAGAYFASPGAAAIENEVVQWLKTVFSFPAQATGCLSSGGSISTLIAFTAARDARRVKNDRIARNVVYLGEQVHHSTQKALRIIGLEDVVLRYVPLDHHHRIDPKALGALIDKDRSGGLEPFMVVATAGTTDTGAIDPLNEIADLASRHGLWFHVDAAYGGFFILTSRKNLFRGIERADSLVVDPHKGLFLPYGVGAVLIKDADAALRSHYYTANYMQDGHNDELLQSPANLSPELTRHFRGLRVWLPLQFHGIAPFTACLEEKLLLVRYFREKLRDLGFQLGPEPDLSVSYFWYPFTTDADGKNRALMEEIHRDGSVFLSSSVIDGRFVIRIAILAFRTKKATVDEALAMIQHSLEKVLSRTT